MKITEILLEKKLRKHKEKPKHDDLDDVEPAVDHGNDEEHIIMQLRKAKDVMGNYPVKFQDGTAFKLIYKDIDSFLEKYSKLKKPSDKEELQKLAAHSLPNWHMALKKVYKDDNLPKIKGSRYMTSFGDEYPETPDEGPRTLDNMSDREEYSKSRDTLKVDPSPEFTPTKAGKGGKHKTNWDKSELPKRNKPEPKPNKKGLRR